MNIDKDGYLMIEKSFKSRGYKYDWIEDLEGNWKIYSVTNGTGKIIDYELIELYKTEEYKLGDAIISKRWAYPGASQFGFKGFSLRSIQGCKNKLQQIKQRKEDRLEKEENKEKPVLDIPKNKEFVIPELARELGVEPIVLSNELTKLKGLGINIIVTGEKKNPRGRNSKIYMIKE